MNKCTTMRLKPPATPRPKLIKRGIVQQLICLCWLAGVSFTPVQAQQQEPKLDVNVTGQSLKTVFQLIRQQTHYLINYSEDEINAGTRVTVKLKQATVPQILKAALQNTGYEYVRSNNTFIITRSATSVPVKTGKGGFTGRVTDDQTGEGIPGVSVSVGGQTITSNEEGVFVVTLSPGKYKTVFSSINYNILQVPDLEVKANQSDTFHITLQRKAGLLQDVVVTTALGLRKDERSLGYAAQKIDGAEVTKAPTSNWINALSGKVPGLQLNKIGGPLGSSDVVLRGDKVLDLNSSTALIVVDGIPITTQQSGTGSGPLVAADNPIDFGSSLSDLNPEDIESVSVLKGPSAAALYGYRASNGAIIITTKSGKKSPGIGVFFSSNVGVSSVNRYPDYQYEYGAGSVGSTYYSYGNTVDGGSTKNSTAGYGPKYNGQSYFQFNSPYADGLGVDPLTAPRTERVPWVPYDNFVSGFFRPGVSISNTVGITGGGYRASITYTKNNWIIPNTGFDRINIALAGTQKISSKITVNSKVNYARKYSDNLPGQGYNNQSIMYFMAQTSNSFDINWFKQRWVEGKEHSQEFQPVSNGYLDNPYMMAYDMLNGSDRHNVIGNINAQIQFTPKLSLMLRTGMDLSYEFRTQQRPISTYKYKEGMYRQQNVFRWENNSDFLLKYQDRISGGFNYSVSVGGNQRNSDYKYDDAMAPKLSLPGIYNLANSKDPIQTTSDRATFAVNSLYGFANIDYKGMVFLELTGRNDWSSTLPKQNASFFYPSVNTSIILDRILHLPSVISLAKLRASYAGTGVAAANPYGFALNYARTAFPGSLQLPGDLPNKDLKPQFTNDFETGFDLRFFDGRLGLDVAVYNNITKNQIVNLPIDGASGFTRTTTNIGKIRNRGVEVLLRATPVQVKNGLKWDVTFNWSANRNKVMDMSDVGQLVLYNVGFANINIVAEEGKPLGQLYGIGFKRSPDGQIINNASGIPVLGTDLQNWGSISPDWQGGVNNSFSWKGLSCSFLIDVRQGGKMMSYSNAILSATGKLTNSLAGRDEGVLGAGVQEQPDGSFKPNATKAAAGNYYNQYYIYGNMETNVFSTSFVKLREVSIAYTIPRSLIKNTFIQNITLGVSGRDLFTWSKFPLFDPETATLNSSQILPGIEIGQFPSTRTINFNLNVNF